MPMVVIFFVTFTTYFLLVSSYFLWYFYNVSVSHNGLQSPILSRYPRNRAHLRLRILLIQFHTGKKVVCITALFPTVPHTVPYSVPGPPESSVRFCQIKRSHVRKFIQIGSLLAVANRTDTMKQFSSESYCQKDSSLDTKIINIQIYAKNAINNFFKDNLLVIGRILKWHLMSPTFGRQRAHDYGSHLSIIPSPLRVNTTSYHSYDYILWCGKDGDYPERAWPHQGKLLKSRELPSASCRKKGAMWSG